MPRLRTESVSDGYPLSLTLPVRNRARCEQLELPVPVLLLVVSRLFEVLSRVVEIRSEPDPSLRAIIFAL